MLRTLSPNGAFWLTLEPLSLFFPHRSNSFTTGQFQRFRHSDLGRDRLGDEEFLKMPFGLRNVGQTFQRLMDKILAGLPFTFVYLDDVLIASSELRTHLYHLRLILRGSI